MSAPSAGTHLGRIGCRDQWRILRKIKKRPLTPAAVLGRRRKGKKESQENQGDSRNRHFGHALKEKKIKSA
jgi:hypothetical protein